MVSPGHAVEGLGFPVSLQGPTLFLDLARLCGGKKKKQLKSTNSSAGREPIQGT